MSSGPRWVALAGAVLATAGGVTRLVAGSTPGAHQSDGVELRPGVVVDGERSALYLMAPGDSVEAIDHASGRLLWKSARAAKPLALVGRLLVAQAAGDRERMLVVVLDVAAGGASTLEATIPMPVGVHPSVDDTLGSTFEVTASAHHGDAIIAWRFTRRAASAMPLEPGGEPAVMPASGTARIDLRSGRVATLDPAALPTPAPPRLPDAVARLVASGAVSSPPTRVGPFLAHTRTATSEGVASIGLERWNAATGEAMPETELHRGPFAVQFPSADGRHLLVSSRLQDEAASWEPYRWSIYSLETGARVADLRAHESAAPFCVRGSRLIRSVQPNGRLRDGVWIDEPLTLRGVDLTSGAPVWTRALRDTTARGPQPPRL